MATHAHSTRTPLLPLSGSRQAGPVTQAIRAMRGSAEFSAHPPQPADLAIAAIEDGLDRHFAEAEARGPNKRAALRKRAAALRERLEGRQSRGGQDPHVPFGPALIAAHTAAMSVRWVFEVEDPGTEPYKAALAVDSELRRLLRDVLALPAPRTVAGLAVVGLATAFEVEGALSHRCLENEDKLAVAARAILSLTGTTMPASFLGFGDEPEFEAREQAILAPPVG